MKKSMINISLIALLAGCATANVPLNSNTAKEDLNTEFFDESYAPEKEAKEIKTTAERIAEEAKAEAVVEVSPISDMENTVDSEVENAMDTSVYKGAPKAVYKVGDPYKIDGVWYFPYEDYYYAEVGQASWYGAEDNGNLTANGEVFDSSELTAAHRTLPMPSVVKVTNVSNGKSVVVKVNDRGPFARDRIIDLSEAAANRLGFIKDGHSTVKVEIMPEESKKLKAQLENGAVAPIAADAVKEPVSFVKEETPVKEDMGITKAEKTYEVASTLSTEHYVQMGAFNNSMNADALVRRLQSSGYKVITENSPSGLIKVRVVGFGSKVEAKSMIPTLENQGFGRGFAQ